jgi:DNA-binding beta-propeller fold protein YncE
VTVDAQSDSVAGVIDYTAPSFRRLAFNPAGNKLYALSYDGLLVISSGGQLMRTIPMTTSATPAMLLDPGLNRLYVVDYQELRVVDCNADSVSRVEALMDINHGLLVQPSASKLYIFPFASSTGGFVRVYDCYRDTVVRTVSIGDETPCAVYVPVTGRVYYAKQATSFVYALDIARDSVVDSIFVGRISGHGRMTADTRTGLLYVLADGADSLCIVDTRQDSLVFAMAIPVNLDTMFLSEASNKLYIANRAAGGPTYVFDLSSSQFIDTLPYGPYRAGLLDSRNDKLYLGASAVTVVDCRSDSVVETLPSAGISVRDMAWDPIGNRVFACMYNRVTIYRDDPYAVEEGAGAAARFGLALLANPVRGSARFRCTVQAGEKATLVLRDVLGRRVATIDARGDDAPVNVIWSGADARGQRVPAGVYFAQLVAGRDRATVKVVLE